jgi:hypothetical protein
MIRVGRSRPLSNYIGGGMFIKLTDLSNIPIYVNSENILYFTRGAGWTIVRFDEKNVKEVQEPPLQIIEIMKGSKNEA